MAGVLISIGCIVYSMCSSKLFGAFLFSFGLFCIVSLKFNLYTGKIGYLVENFNFDYVKELGLTLLGNFVGAYWMAILINSTRIAVSLREFIVPIVEVKNTDTFLSLAILSFFCGILMFLGVEINRSAENPISKVLAIIFVVVIFILSGFEHCIANMFYMLFVKNVDIARLFIMILGNTVGSLFMAFALETVQFDQKKT